VLMLDYKLSGLFVNICGARIVMYNQTIYKH
jgi:hypothetical protein